MLNLFLFSHYSLNKRADLVWRHGRFLALRQERDCSVALYDLRAFFAEVWYAQEGNEILLVRGFRDPGMLAPYLEGIDLEGLLE
ncbi:hypothetical protein GCM10023188_43970 [Pontibacter saemangeumensis]|uniref:Uncharacterized protein n=1 Tax=Pontibacter saemangeumensis TaxID=1084525 RepID=A0ABP8M2M6_9BACT